jgi:hypothetical protein
MAGGAGEIAAASESVLRREEGGASFISIGTLAARRGRRDA